MKLLRYGPVGSERPGVLDKEGRIRDLSEIVKDIDSSFLESGLLGLCAEIDIENLPLVQGDPRIGRPVANCGKFICVGLNYADHAAESGAAIPTEPLLFMKATSAIVGPNDDVKLPVHSTKVDWEVELGIVIGQHGKYISEETALHHVAGVCVINDVSERNFQLERGSQWDKGKGCDTFGPIGPYLVTLDEAGDLDNLPIWLELNGRRVQNSSTSNLIFKVPYLVHYISQFMSLQPGDIISTGTPPGVGLGMKPPLYLKEGDVMRLGIGELGVQQQRVIPEDACYRTSAK